MYIEIHMLPDLGSPPVSIKTFSCDELGLCVWELMLFRLYGPANSPREASRALPFAGSERTESGSLLDPA